MRRGREPLVKVTHILMDHRMMTKALAEPLVLLWIGEFSVNQQV